MRVCTYTYSIQVHTYTHTCFTFVYYTSYCILRNVRSEAYGGGTSYIFHAQETAGKKIVGYKYKTNKDDK